MSKPLRIILIEDDPADAELVRRTLDQAPLSYTLRQVQDEAGFIHALNEAPVDLVLADYSMPDFTGPAALRLVREKFSDIPFISISGSINAERAMEIIRLGASDHVPKDDPAKLFPAIQAALREAEQNRVQRRAAASLRDSEARFRALFEGAGSGVAVEDLDGRIMETNRALQQMLGYSAEELLEITRQDFTHGRDHREDQLHYQRLLAGESDYYQVEKRFVRKDGRIIWGRLTVSMARDAAGKPQFTLAMIEDITERQRSEEFYMQFASIVEFSNDAIISTTFDGIIFSWNPAAERVYGYTANEANGRSLSSIIPPDKEEEWEQILQRIKQGERVDNFETTRVRKDGQVIHVSVTTSAIQDVAGRIIGASSISRDITGRKQAEAALRESEENYRKLVELSPDGILIQSEGKYAFVNGAAMQMLGAKAPAELIGRPVLELVHPDYREAAQENLALLQAGKDVPLHEEKLIRVDGSLIDVEAVAIPFQFRGRPAIQVVIRDITERQRAEKALRKSEASLARAQRIAHLGNWEWDIRTNQLAWSDETYRIFGLNRSECESSNELFYRCVHPDDREMVRRGVDETLRAGKPYSVDHRIILPGGEIKTVSEQAEVILDELGRPIRMLGTVLDITERVRAELENQKLAAFPQFNPNPVMELAADGSINYFNEAARQMTLSLGKQDPSEFLPPETPEIVRDCLATGRSKLRVETVIQSRTISCSFFPVQTIGVVHCYAGDVTDRQNLEAQLRQSQKMESIGQLAGGIAHDFNNILTVIQGHTSLLGMTGNLPEDAQESARQIGMAAERAANLTRQLLTFSRRQIMQPKNLDLNEVVKTMTTMLRRLLGEDITLQVSCTMGLPLIHADPGMMEQIVLNLAINARDAMPRGGSLFVDTSTVTIDEAYAAQVPQAVAGDYVCLTVKDTGTGIAPEILPRIFEPFFTTKDVGKGTGLGLATVYAIVQQHHGWIKTSSTLDKGTLFQIFLPAAEAKSGTAETRQIPESQVRGGQETILVVEDEPPLRTLVRSVLQRYGYRVLEAVSGMAALAVWELHKNEIQLLLTDMVMPHGLGGRELAQKLLADKPALKVIYSSGYSLAVVGTDMVLQEGLNFLQKPYHPRKLAQAVRDCLDG
jgi:PAS domain S-box-containing protein